MRRCISSPLPVFFISILFAKKLASLHPGPQNSRYWSSKGMYLLKYRDYDNKVICQHVQLSLLRNMYCIYPVKRPNCSMWGMSTLRMDKVCDLQLQGCWSHGRGGGSICGGQGSQGGTASHAWSIHQGGWRCSHSPHTQRSWNVSVDRRTAGERCESFSCGTRGSISVWRPSRTAHICKDEYLQQGQWGWFLSFMREPMQGCSTWLWGCLMIQATLLESRMQKIHLQSVTLGGSWCSWYSE